MRRIAQLVPALLTLGILVLTGCADPADDAAGSGGSADGADTGAVQPDEGTSNDSGSIPPPGTTPPPSAAAVPTDVTITIDDGAGTVTEYTLTCAPEGGDHPNAAAACSSLAAASAVFGPADPNQACTEIFGGPQTATVSGTLNGAAVQGSFSRANGCEIARWDALTEVFGPTTGAS